MTRSAGLQLRAAWTAVVVLLSGCAGSDSEPTGAPEALSKRAAEAAVYDEFQVRQDACMGERGYPVTVHEDGGRQYAGSGYLERDALLALLGECATEAGGEPTAEPLSEAEISALYDLDVQAYECLVAAGFDPEPPSTREAYLAAFANETPPWTPFSDASIPSGQVASDPCPQPGIEDIPDQE